MKKYSLFLLNLGVMVLAFVFASCSGGSSSKLTNEGIFGEMPGYLLQYLDLKQKCVEELEFEDNKDKRAEIINKYTEQWDKIFTFDTQQKLHGTTSFDICSQLNIGNYNSPIETAFLPVPHHVVPRGPRDEELVNKRRATVAHVMVNECPNG